MGEAVTFGSLFAGVGGFDLGFERAGMIPVWQVEKNKTCTRILSRHWPQVQRYADIKESHTTLPFADVVTGGDPCPKHSHARSNGDSKSPDLSGYFLAVARKITPLVGGPRECSCINCQSLRSSTGSPWIPNDYYPIGCRRTYRPV